MTGPLLLVLGLSGTALVFEAEIGEALHRPPALVGGGAPVRSLDAIVGAALTSHPASEPRALRLPPRPDQPYRVELYSGKRRVDVAVDPYTLRVLGGRAPERSLLLAVRSLHGGFHGGRPGALLVGLLGLWLTAEGVTGLWLHRPPTKRRPRALSLHRFVGGLSLVLSVIVGVTGALLALASTFAVADAGATTAAPAPGRLARLDAVARRADVALPGGRITALVAESGPTVRVEKRVPGNDMAERVGSVLIDRDTGTIVAAGMEPTRAGVWDVIRRLHHGDFAGWASRIAYAMVGLALPVLSITGVLISSRRRA